MLVGLNVVDGKKYEAYRENMKPILSKYGGGFNYDFKVAEVFLSQAEHDINRLFTIHFPDRKTMKSFFSDDEYAKVKKQFYDHAVTSATVLADYSSKQDHS